MKEHLLHENVILQQTQKQAKLKLSVTKPPLKINSTLHFSCFVQTSNIYLILISAINISSISQNSRKYIEDTYKIQNAQPISTCH